MVLGRCNYSEGPKGKAVNLTIKGEDITQEMMNQVQYRIESVSGVVTWDNLSIESTRHFFNVIDCQGGIIIKTVLNWLILRVSKRLRINIVLFMVIL